ncbi:LEAF RUST 10 DISEASE-RESISTANCE LOCUS RECEPTOR-LIKE PROTEIN KINASE-like 1.2 isoform X1 [Nicotiana tabacum]|uniref:non-specific serine/threonine protein kinase n=2 Tax=Nicotiana TaxID=4085 RepID=A0A1S4A0W2_TOBAC|nr:PREDICTED: probable serine/threonine-protein kinase At1g18390 isoform X1 [Nicotiana sylvestris]XP_016470235.1 PREDICTED: LEAF RUST 10 DISEASE-RESISTANCE LOCUS RECEPTOR-LIKE PROTEIN KINASE-like 1.2 isoform X1 [Nicotiana tabacum]
MCPSQLFSFFFVFLLLPLFINSSEANTNTSFAYCPPFICHGRNISYPFWSLDSFNSTSPRYCGYPGFGIHCSQNNPILNISNDSFFVKDINYSTYSLTLVDIDAFGSTACPRVHHNLTLGDLPLKYSELDLNLTFYFNCINSLSSGRPLDCLNSGRNKSYLYVEDNEPDHLNWYGICDKKVVATVMDSGRNRELGVAVGEEFTRGLGAAMDEGFVLDWRIATECGKCEASDGRCGYDNSTNESLCYCKDGTVKFDHCKGRNKIGLKVGIGVGAAASTALMAGVIFFIYRCRQKKIYAGSSLFSTSILSYPSSIKDPEKATTLIGVHLFDYNELDEATNNFDSKKELGDGGYGTVYKGKLRDGRVVAVKRLYENNCKRVEQFMNEIDILTRLHHPNLVTLYGCTSRHSRELLLVYEYIPNGTVSDHLHGVHSKPGSLSWNTRMKISIETASALAYLHASDVIHRDVKTNNILLDNNFCVKVADFGLSRLFPTDVTHVSTAPQGTPGYVDPEYHECYQLTDKSDVYSFGVVLIELISSLPAVDICRHRHEINLSNMAINKIQGNALHELVDSNLGFDTDDKVRSMITAVAELAFQCLQSDRELRPSMQEVVEALMRIQRINKTTGKTDKECPDDDTGLLNSITLLVSPDSVTTKWSSSPTTPNS